MTETDAKGVRGYLLWDFNNKELVFRVYDGERKDRSTYKDYRIMAEDVEITIESRVLSLIEHDDGTKRLTWASKYLERKQ